MQLGEIYHIASIACYVLSAAAFALAVFLFFRYRIIDAFNVLSGRKLKQDMERLSHLSGEASEDRDDIEFEIPKKKKEKKPKKNGDKENVQDNGTDAWIDTGTEELYQTEATEELYQTEATEELYDTETTDELYEPDSDDDVRKNLDETEELDILVTDASETELL